MFRRVAPALFKANKGLFVKTLPNGFDYCKTSPTDVLVSAVEEVPKELQLTLTRQDEFLFAQEVVTSVTITSENGQMSVLPGHEYVVEKLCPGLLEVEVDGKTSKYITSGGFAHVNTGGSVDIQTAECIPLEHLDLAHAEKELAAAQEIAKGNDEAAKVRAEVGVAMLEPVVAALKA